MAVSNVLRSTWFNSVAGPFLSPKSTNSVQFGSTNDPARTVHVATSVQFTSLTLLSKTVVRLPDFVCYSVYQLRVL